MSINISLDGFAAQTGKSSPPRINMCESGFILTAKEVSLIASGQVLTATSKEK